MGRLSLISAISTLSLLQLVGCTSESSSSPSAPTQEKQIYASREFLYNYELLSYYYNDAAKYLGKPEDYLGKVSDEAFEEYAIPWDYYDIYYMYNQMNDKYTYYTDPSQASALWTSILSSPATIDPGIEWTSTASGEFFVTSVVPNSPASNAGIKAGDQITAIEGVPLTSELIFKRLSLAEEGDTITYTIQHDSTTKTIPIVLVAYNTPTIDLSFKDSIPILKISKFKSQTSNEAGTYGEFVEYMISLSQYSSIVIDLRNNGGGDGEQCLGMAQEFLSVGDSSIGIISAIPDTITKTQTFDTTFTVNDFDGIARNHYFVFLANGNTASCSEIMLAAVTMNKDYPIVGTTTYGKGIGQNNFMTPSLSIATITGMKVVNRDFVSYHSVGIEPDIVEFNNQAALEKAVELAKEMSYKRTAGYGTTNTGHFAKSAVVQDTMPSFYFLPKEMRKKISRPFAN